MTINTENMMRSILENIAGLDYIKPEDIPNIDLYMDQVTTFMDEHLASSRRYPDDKILTKTMINNYAKNHLLPPPEKKKYSKEHVLMMIFIYYFKSILSISDIQALLSPLTEKYFQQKEGLNIEALYQEVFSMQREQVDRMQKDLLHKFKIAKNTFQNAAEEDRKFLCLFSFICLLSFDVYIKKELIESIIDSFPSD